MKSDLIIPHLLGWHSAGDVRRMVLEVLERGRIDYFLLYGVDGEEAGAAWDDSQIYWEAQEVTPLDVCENFGGISVERVGGWELV